MHATSSMPPTDVLTSNGHRLDSGPRRLGRLEPVPASERTDRAALRARFRRDGYLFLPGFFDRATVLGFRRHYFSRLAPSGLIRPGTDPVDGVAAPADAVDRATLRRLLFREVVPGPAYEALCRDRRLAGFHSWFLGAPEVHLHRRKIIRHVGPGESGIGTATQAHYDLVYLREGTDRVVSSWIPLGDVPLARGPLVYLENSHHEIRRQEATGVLKRPAASLTADLPALAEEFDSRWLVTDFAAGDLMVHDAYLVHASLDNHDPAGRFRLSTDIRHQSAAQPVDARWQHHWSDDDGL